MSATPRFARSGLARVLTLVSVAAASMVAVTVVATASHAATCSGYVGLTFDDGPTPGNTLNLLNTLKAAGVRATLFNEGSHAQQNPSLVQAEVAANMWIGNHTWDHPHMTQLSTSQMTSEVSQTQQVIQQITGTAPKLFRPPYGETNSTLHSIESQYGLTEIIWDVDSQDWNGASVSQIVSAADRLTAGQVILMHDWPANTITAIPQIVSHLASRNLCAGMISPSTGRAVAPDGSNPPPTSPTSPPPPSDSPSATPPPNSGGSCQVTNSVSAWNTGLVDNLTITNTGSSAINGWRLTFTLASGQTITSGWNATYSPSSGQVTATNLSYNATIPAGGSVSIGYQATHTGNTANPTNVTLNGASCATA